MGISLMRGRLLSDADAADSSRFDHRESGAGPEDLGRDRSNRQADQACAERSWLSVVGIVADIKNHGSNGPTKPEIYFYVYRISRSRILAESALDVPCCPNGLSAAVKSPARFESNSSNWIRRCPSIRSQPWSRWFRLPSRKTAFRRSPSQCLLRLLMLAAVGVYGVLAYTVAQSRHEIGVRMALGRARGTDSAILPRARECAGQSSEMRRDSRPRSCSCDSCASMLFEISAYDPRTLMMATGVLTVVVAAACLVPALRATRVDPIGGDPQRIRQKTTFANPLAGLPLDRRRLRAAPAGSWRAAPSRPG